VTPSTADSWSSSVGNSLLFVPLSWVRIAVIEHILRRKFVLNPF
jgi:hypothetical protein